MLDEAWQLLKYEAAAVAHAERLRPARAYGLSTIMVLHRPGDTCDAQRLLRLNDVETQAIRSARTGELLWSVESATKGRQSWSVYTRRSPAEAALWNTRI